MLYISLYPAQHEWLEDEVEAGELVFIHDRLLLRVTLNVPREPFIEFFMGVKHGRHDEVKQSPELRGEEREGERGRNCTC